VIEALRLRNPQIDVVGWTRPAALPPRRDVEIAVVMRAASATDSSAGGWCRADVAVAFCDGGIPRCGRKGLQHGTVRRRGAPQMTARDRQPLQARRAGEPRSGRHRRPNRFFITWQLGPQVALHPLPTTTVSAPG
jgi:hypothetical protein